VAWQATDKLSVGAQFNYYRANTNFNLMDYYYAEANGDAKDFFDRIANSASANIPDEVKTAASNAAANVASIVATSMGNDGGDPGLNGVAIWLPRDPTEFNNHAAVYNGFDFSAETGWPGCPKSSPDRCRVPGPGRSSRRSPRAPEQAASPFSFSSPPQ
jgi:hypothetical protein